MMAVVANSLHHKKVGEKGFSFDRALMRDAYFPENRASYYRSSGD
jgi:hypothetical protein